MLHHVKEHVKDLVLPNNMFDDMGFYYIGPVDGHDEQQLEKMLRWARDLRQPVLLHVVTQKVRASPTRSRRRRNTTASARSIP